MANKPTVLILRGDDEFAMHAYIDKLIAGLGDPSLAEMNTTRLDGRSASEEQIRNATLSLPFLTEKRLAVLSYPFSRLTTKDSQTRFISLLENLPQTTLCVLVVYDVPKNRKIGDQWGVVWEVLAEKHWLVQWCHQVKGKAEIKDYRLPSAYDMPNWIMQRARELGGEFRPAAAKLLASHTGNDTRLAEMEIDKLLNFVDFKHPVEVEDVEVHTVHSTQASVFDLTDSLSEGNQKTAQRLLHRLLEDEDAQAVFSMIIRQYRMLIQAREILDEGGDIKTIQREVVGSQNMSEFVAKKLTTQAQRWELLYLQRFYRQLLNIDEAVKTSQMPLDVSLDLLVAESRSL